MSRIRSPLYGCLAFDGVAAYAAMEAHQFLPTQGLIDNDEAYLIP
jgi:hypothetical protein